jgi:hypothetical protein
MNGKYMISCNNLKIVCLVKNIVFHLEVPPLLSYSK